MTYFYILSGLTLFASALLIWRVRSTARAAQKNDTAPRCPFHILFGSRKVDSSAKSKPATGLNWKESYLDGSPAAEAAFIEQALQDINAVQELNKARGHAQKYGRAFHAKIQGGVKNAVFRIAPDLPENLQIGHFQPGKEYPAAVRLSNASGLVQADTVKDLRGIAVRVYVDGGEIHDYLGTNGSVNHARNARQFIQFAKAGAGSRFLMLPRLICSVGLCETVRMLRTVIKQSSRPVESLCEETYWSRAPYLLGEQAVKFQFTPSQSEEVHVEKTENYLHADLLARLRLGDVVFDYQVQLYQDESSTPIEDGAVEWSSPLVTVAQLLIPQQDISEESAQTAQTEVENMEFNPWNTTELFRPLGSLNRARRLVYKASVKLRKSSETRAS
jgi:hypothetical protein